MTRPTLVVGGTGKTGRRVAERLEARGVPVRIASRRGVPPFDWADAGTWPSALRNVESAYVTYYPDLSVPGAAEAVGAFARLAVHNDVRRLVLLSGRGEEGALFGERALADSGAEWTILRSAWFNQNFGEGDFLEQVKKGEIALPVGEVREPFLDADDIADVAVAALTEDGHARKIYELTGPRLMTFAEAVAEIARAARREIRYVQVSAEQFASQLVADGVPDEYVSLLSYLFTEVLDGRNSNLADGVQRALGRPPRDFSEYARATAATGVWGGVHARTAQAVP